jgi:hypothetical protein
MYIKYKALYAKYIIDQSTFSSSIALPAVKGFILALVKLFVLSLPINCCCSLG